MREIRALVFDFDGLILDTEQPIFDSWQELYQEYGCQLSFEKWAAIIGASEEEAHFDPLAELETQLGHELDDRQQVSERRRKLEMERILEQMILPGVYEYLRGARSFGLKIGLASSSPSHWILGHLTRLGLLHFFDCIRTADDVQRAKPDPALYLDTMSCLGVPPKQGIAFEDSPNGALAAKRAGLYTVAVPNNLTRVLNLEHADLLLNSLLDIPLEQLITKVEQERN
jgi:HAD superfamily hydrolase (TIGR01509 family)